MGDTSFPLSLSTRRNLVHALCAIAAIAMSMPTRSYAQETQTSAPVQTEIVVRSSLLPDSLQESPANSTIIRGEDQELLGTAHLQDVLDSVPNLNWSGGTSRPTFFQIRGIGEVEQYEGTPNTSVGVFLDDIDFSTIGSVASFYDIDQVEVVRGPQSVGYGASALAGVISLRSRDPTPYSESSAQVSLGSDALSSFGVAAGGPVEGTEGILQYRVSAFQYLSDGFRDNLYLNRSDTNNRDEFTARLKLKATPSNDFRVELTLLGMDFDNGYDTFAIDNSLNTQSDRPGDDSQGTGAFALRLEADLSDSASIRSISTGLHTKQDYSYDGDWGNNPFWEPYVPYDYFAATDRTREILSQEVQLHSPDQNYQHGETSRWVTGVYAQRLSEDTQIRNSSDGEVYDFYESDYVGTTTAVFGEYEFPLAPRTALRIGGRLENRDTTFHDNRDFNQGPDDLMWGGSITLDHFFEDDLNVFLTASRGFKGPGVNVSIGVPPGQETYDAESLYNLEAGVKSQFLDQRLTWNTSVFAMFRDDVQTELSFQSDPTDPLTFIYLTDNAARGQNIGLETELSYRPTNRTVLRVAGSLLHTEFTEVDEPERFLEGRDQAQSPHWQYAVSARRYLNDWVFVESSMTGKAGYYYQDSHNARSSSYHLLGAAIGFESANWGISIWGKNLLDQDYAVRGFFFGNEPPDFRNTEYIQRGDPLQVGTTVFIRFS